MPWPTGDVPQIWGNEIAADELIHVSYSDKAAEGHSGFGSRSYHLLREQEKCSEVTIVNNTMIYTNLGMRCN